MTEGLQAMAKAAAEGALGFRVTLCCGGVLISGRVAPAQAFFDVSRQRAAQAAPSPSANRIRSGGFNVERRSDRVDEQQAVTQRSAFTSDVDAVQRLAGSDVDELTLIEVSVSTQVAGGVSLPVARVPIASVDTWWIVSGEVWKQGFQSMWGFAGGF